MIRRFRAKPLPPKLVIVILSLIILLVVGLIISANDNDVVVDDFDSCVAAGNPVAESFPEQCFHNGSGYVNQN